MIHDTSTFQRRLPKAGLLCMLILSISALAQAQAVNQSPERGFHAGGSYALSEVETLSQFSGEVGLRIPLGSLPPGRGGLSAQLFLLYSSKVWDTFESQDDDGFGNLYDSSRLKLAEDGGWRYGFQYRLKLNFLKPPDIFTSPCDQTYHTCQLSLVTPDGGQHKLWLDGHSDSTGFMDVLPDGNPACLNAPPGTGDVRIVDGVAHGVLN